MIINNRVSIIIFIISAIGCIFDSDAFSGESLFSMTETVEKQIVIEKTNIFYSMNYEPSVEVNVLEVTPEKLKRLFSPEMTVVAYLSASAQGDHEWYKANLTETLQKKHDKTLTESGLSGADFARKLQKEFENKKVELVSRVDRGRYILIRYRLLSAADGAVVKNADIILKQEGRWKIAELPGDIVFNNWEFEGKEKRIIVRK